VILRGCRRDVSLALRERNAVLVWGIRRAGRTALAQEFADDSGGLVTVLDARYPACCAEISDVVTFAEKVAGQLVIIDHIDEAIADAVARLVHSTVQITPQPQFLLLTRRNTVAAKLAQELTGLVRIIELGPIQPDEGFAAAEVEVSAEGPLEEDAAEEFAPVPTNGWSLETHWLRGGLPESLLAKDDRSSYNWRTDYLAALLAENLRDWGSEAGDRPRDVIGSIVRNHGQEFDEDKCRSELGIDRNSLRRTLDILIRLGLIRQLPNWFRRGRPILYIRDSGLLHALRDIESLPHLRNDAVYGHSWGCFAAEALISAAGNVATPSFYRDKEDHEIDLILDFTPRFEATIAIEFKVDGFSNVEAGFWRACDEVKPTHKFMVHSGSALRKCGGGIEIAPLLSVIKQMRTVSRNAPLI
jgi:predicted AAA+ superfamily ATPase